jgi:hypothetical protein
MGHALTGNNERLTCLFPVEIELPDIHIRPDPYQHSAYSVHVDSKLHRASGAFPRLEAQLDKILAGDFKARLASGKKMTLNSLYS